MQSTVSSLQRDTLDLHSDMWKHIHIFLDSNKTSELCSLEIGNSSFQIILKEYQNDVKIILAL